MRQRVSIGVATTAFLLLVAPHHLSASRSGDNPSLLGIVATETEDGLVSVARVLRKSPAAAIGLRRGDRLLSIAQTAVTSARHVDQLLGRYQPGDTVDLSLLRKEQPLDISVTLAARSLVREAVPRRPRGTVGFPAPPWYGYAWDLPNGVPAPTQEKTRGKVVVIHAFQSW